MLEGLGVNLADVGATGLVVLVVLMILSGRLVTRGQLLDERAEKKLWQENAQGQQKINAENASAITNYTEAALVQQKVMRALQLRHGLTQADLDQAGEDAS